ncbi:MAG: hypothetical protein RR980_01955 [Mucinivorans sp.]
MTKIFIPTDYSLSKIEKIVDELKNSGIDVQNTQIMESFNDFAKTLDPDDKVVVYSCTCFASLMDMLSAIKTLDFYSQSEQWLTQPVQSPRQFLAELHELAIKIHGERTTRGLEQAKRNGKTLGRAHGSKKTAEQNEALLVAVDTLRRENNISLAKACQIAGCTTYTYYENRKRLFAQIKK